VQLSVIIPTLNEADNLPALLRLLRDQTGTGLEIIVADGGSSDATRELARQQGVVVVETTPGRGAQMNRGTAIATAPWLLFLHADSIPTSTSQLAQALTALQAACTAQKNERIAGHFRLRFERSQPGHDLAYHYYEEKSALNRPECTNGDQGFLLSKAFFNELGGFDESLWFLEDQRLAEKIRRSGGWITLPGVLATSARRFETEGLGRRLLL
jgi:rSAM/selenodomain-associated transferase 2